MISNQIEIEISKEVHIEPVLIDYKDDQLAWGSARQLLDASCIWLNVSNATPYGVFTVDPDGSANFTPTSGGQFDVLCVVSYTDQEDQSVQQTQQLYTLIINDDACQCEVEVSNKPDNRLVKEPDKSLYVPELQVDLNQVYTIAKDEPSPPDSSSIISEDILAEFAQAVGEDIADLREQILDGGKDIIKIPTNVDISALLCVYEFNGIVRVLDYRDEVHIDLLVGITSKSASAGNLATIQRTGYLEDSFWNFTPGRVYLGANGTLTQIAPLDGFDVLIGVAVSPTKLFIKIQDPIEMEN